MPPRCQKERPVVDHDIFRAHVDPGFQTAARAVFDRTDPKRGVDRTLYVASVSLKAGGCPGLHEIELTVLDLSKRGASQTDRRHALRVLDDIKQSFVSSRTATAIEAAKQFVRTEVPEMPIEDEVELSEVVQRLAAKIVIRMLDRQLFPGGLLQGMVESRRETWDSWGQRRRAFLSDLERSDGFVKVVTELRADPNGAQVKRQYAKRAKIDQYELATAYALT